MVKRNRITFIAALIAVSLSIHLSNFNWAWHVRLGLALGGYPFARLKSPDSALPHSLLHAPPLVIATTPSLPHAFAHDLAYQGDSYVGYVDPDGDFFRAGNFDRKSPSTGTLASILFLMEICAVAMLVGLIIRCFVPKANRSDARRN